jgi:hypothetical protein
MAGNGRGAVAIPSEPRRKMHERGTLGSYYRSMNNCARIFATAVKLALGIMTRAEGSPASPTSPGNTRRTCGGSDELTQETRESLLVQKLVCATSGSRRRAAILVTVGTIVAAFATSPAISNAEVPPLVRAPIGRPSPFNAKHAPSIRKDAQGTGGCSSDYSAPSLYFVALSAGADVASAAYSATLGGAENEACETSSAIGAGYDNQIGNAGGYGNNSFIAGGVQNYLASTDSFIGAGTRNYVDGDQSFVGGGQSNQAVSSYSAVGGGAYNSILAEGGGSFIGAGGYIDSITGTATFGNAITAPDGFIGAGDMNNLNGAQGFIGSGNQNTIDGSDGFIGAGEFNSIGSSASYASILGGNRNSATGEYASVLGGFGSTASGAYAIVAGGDADLAGGTLSFAAGYHAHATHNGTFAWSDYVSGSATLADTAANQFLVRASGGVRLYSNEALTSGVMLAAGSGTWASLSDRNGKTDVLPLDDASVLARVSTLAVQTWRYKSERGVRHVGPMAQDFYKAFGVGEDDRHITSIDEDGIALAAIKALEVRMRAVERENDRLRRQLYAMANLPRRR